MMYFSEIARRPKSEQLSTLSHPQPWLSRMFPGSGNDTGVNVDETKALAFSAVHRANKLIGRSIAAQPKMLYRRDGEERHKIPEAPARHLVHQRPNQMMSAFTFWFTITVHVLQWGNGYARIHRDPITRDPVSFELWKPWETWVILHEGEKWFRHGRENKAIPESEVLHFMGISLDGIKGLSPIQYAARQAIGIGLVQEKYEASLYGEGLHQGASITLPPGETLGDNEDEIDANVKAYRQAFEDTYKGPENFHKLLILEDGMKLEKMGMPLESAQFIQSRKFNLSEIGRFYDLPPHKLYDLERSTHNNVEHQEIEYVQDCILPWNISFENELNRKTLREAQKPDHYFKFNTNVLLRADMKSRAEYYSRALGSTSPAWMTQDEVRAKEDDNPRGGNADELHSPANTKLTNMIDEDE